MTGPPRLAPRRSFTLLEVVIALSLGIVLLGAMFGFLFNMLDMRQVARDLVARQRAATTLFEMIDRHLTTVVVGDPALGAGLAGDDASLRLLVRGVDVSLAERSELAREVMDDRSIMEYRFEPSRGVVEARRAFPEPSSAPAGDFELIGSDLYLVRFRYHDGQAWRDSFDSLAANTLPVAVEVAIWFDPWPGAEERDEAQSGGGIRGEVAGFDSFPTAEDGFADPRDDRVGALRGDGASAGEPVPDRRCVISIPDARRRESS